ncbi:hypothetical protein [Streptomyces sp. NPDC056069]|uniref:hypothetical protein n=1 Tax=Streptomyces sp. NPDC056069 TaxID=3345702 RepID=UPI0035D6EC32
MKPRGGGDAGVVFADWLMATLIIFGTMCPCGVGLLCGGRRVFTSRRCSTDGDH